MKHNFHHKTTAAKKSGSVSSGRDGESFFPSCGRSKDAFFAPAALQPKLEVGQPGDKYEREAGRVADAVMRMPDPQIQRRPLDEEEELKMRQQPEIGIQRKCEECEEKEKLQKKNKAKTSNSGKPFASHNISSQLKSSSGKGSRLPKDVQTEMGTKIGVDFSGVNVHTGPVAQKLNRQLDARAFTYGRDIYFNEGEYNPASDSGKYLLAHELTHVAQQANGSVRRISRIPKEEEIPSRYNFTANCGWIDWGHAQPDLSRNLITRVQNASDALRAAGQGSTATGRLNTPSMQSIAPGGIVLSSASLSIQLLRPLSSQEVLSVALSIFKRLSLVFETLQEWTDFIGHSSFSQEDLPSNLIGFYRAAMNYSRSDIENYCGLVTANNPIRRNVSTPRFSGVLNITSSLQEYRRDHDFERNYTFTPVDTVGPWPSQLSSISTANADSLYEIQTIQAQRGPHNTRRLCPVYRVVGRIGETDLFILSVGGHEFKAADNLRVKPTYDFRPTTHGAYGHTTLIEVEPYGPSDAAQFRTHDIPSPIEMPENVLVCLSSHSNPI